MVSRKGSLTATNFCIDIPRIRKRPNAHFFLLGVVLALQLTNQCHGSDDRRRPPPPPSRAEARVKRVDNWSQRPRQRDPYSSTSSGSRLDQPYSGAQNDLPDTSTASWHPGKSRLDQQDIPYRAKTDPSSDHAAAPDWYNNDDAAATQPYPNRDRYNYYDYDGDTNQHHLPSQLMVRNAATSGTSAGQMPIHYEFPLSREAPNEHKRQEQEIEMTRSLPFQPRSRHEEIL
jgi:hypothetical protein